MAIEYQGQTFVPLSPQENALTLVNYINEQLIINNVLDSEGSQAQIFVNAASPIWLILLAVGFAISTFQWLLQAAGNSLSIENCSDPQLLNLAQIAGTERIAGTKTILFVTVTAGPAGCTVTPANTLFYTPEISFVPVGTTVIGASGTAEIETLASVVGPIYILAGEITAFNVTPVGVASVVNAADSIPGRALETYLDLRKRLQAGGNILTSLDAAMFNIRNLEGISYCTIFFNPSLVNDLVIPGPYTIPPRTALPFIHGSNDDLASTFFSYLLCETVGNLSVEYTSLSGQVIDLNYRDVTFRDIYIKIVIAQDSGGINFIAEARRELLKASGTLSVGDNYTQQYLINYLDNFQYADIISLYVSMDGITWSDITELNGNEVGVITSDNIEYEEK